MAVSLQETGFLWIKETADQLFSIAFSSRQYFFSISRIAILQKILSFLFIYKFDTVLEPFTYFLYYSFNTGLSL